MKNNTVIQHRLSTVMRYFVARDFHNCWKLTLTNSLGNNGRPWMFCSIYSRLTSSRFSSCELIHGWAHRYTFERTYSRLIAPIHGRTHRFTVDCTDSRLTAQIHGIAHQFTIDRTSASFLAEISVRSPRNVFKKMISKKHLDQSIQKNVLFHLENRSIGAHRFTVERTDSRLSAPWLGEHGQLLWSVQWRIEGSE